MSDLTHEQRRAVDAAKNEIRRRVQQMLSSGRHDIPAIKHALQEIVEAWG